MLLVQDLWSYSTSGILEQFYAYHFSWYVSSNVNLRLYLRAVLWDFTVNLRILEVRNIFYFYKEAQ